MLEIMCRDGSVSQDMLNDIAEFMQSVYRSEVGEVVALDKEDTRALVFWGRQDIKNLLAQCDYGVDVPEEWASDYLKEIEPELHRASLEAGWEVIELSFDDKIDDYLQETYGVRNLARLDGVDPNEFM